MAKAPTPAPTPARTAVTARGIPLLALIAAAEAGVLMLTQDEGAEAVNAGHASVDASIVEGDTAAVSLTDAGRAALAAASEKVEDKTGGNTAASSTFGIDADIPMPGNNTGRRARSGGYPFEALEVGNSFHVAKPGDATLDELLTRISSSVSGARARFSVEIPGETETVKVKTYKKGDDNKFVKDGAGKRVVATETEETRPKTKLTRDFFAAKVDGNDPKGEGVRIWRVELKA